MPADMVYQDDRFTAFKDIHPKASLHLLIVPRKHIQSVEHIELQDSDLMGRLILTARKIARQQKLEGYKLEINVGRAGGQLVDHLHLHLLSGKMTGEA